MEPEGPTPCHLLLAEIDQAETTHRRQESIEQGIRQVEAFLAQGQGSSAELALKILVQMDPENRHRKGLEKQIKAIAGRRGIPNLESGWLGSHRNSHSP